MHKDLTILGTLSLSGSLMMYVEPEEERLLHSCLQVIGKTLQNILSRCDSSQEVVISIMQADLIVPTTTVTFYVQKKTPEKNGAQ
jgi:hypothetical protein